MNILITGASGLVGSATADYLSQQGHMIYRMSRTDTSAPFYWQDQGHHQWDIHWDESIAIDAVIHLAGENIGTTRWSAEKKRRIVDSRLDTTTALVNKLQMLTNRPTVFICASAIGYYGDCGDQVVDEHSPNGRDFLANLAVEWENRAQAATEYGIRVVNIRTSLVLDTKQGALAKMLLPFKLGLGGPIGNGRQVMSWVSIQEIPKMITFLLHHEAATGAYNLVSPYAVSNREFTQTLAASLSRPALIPMPAFVVKALFGEMGELLLLGSIHVTPKRLHELGYTFDDLNLADTFKQLLN